MAIAMGLKQYQYHSCFTSGATAFVAASCILASPALAQSQPSQADRDAARIQQQQEQQQQDRASQFNQRQNRPPSGVEVHPDEQIPVSVSGCAAVREVRVVGVTRYAPGAFEPELARLKGSCTGLDAINTVLHAITDRYVQDGYVTSRAFVAPQNVKAGILIITVIEGRVAGLNAKGSTASTRPFGTGDIAAAFPEHGGDVLNLRGLEQGVDQLARMAGSDPTIDLVPGDAPATSTVEVKRTRKGPPMRASWAINNNGAASTGRLQQMAMLDVDSPLGLADVWSLYWNHDVEGQTALGSGAWGGFVSLPRGWWTLSLSGGKSTYHARIDNGLLVFPSNGSSWNASANLDRMVHRDATTKLSLSAGFAVIDTSSFIGGIQLQTGSYRIVAANLGAHWQKRIGQSLIASNIGYSRGLDVLGAHTVDTGVGGATGAFNLVSADASVQSRFAVGPTRFTNNLTLRGQWGFDNLFPAQSFGLGGVSTIRGFRDDGIAGRTGASLREQLGFGIRDLAKGDKDFETRLSGYLAYDVGGILPNGWSPYERGLIQSGSLGVKAEGRHIQTDLALSVPISAPAFVSHKTTEFTASIRVLL